MAMTNAKMVKYIGSQGRVSKVYENIVLAIVRRIYFN